MRVLVFLDAMAEGRQVGERSPKWTVEEIVYDFKHEIACD
jgi:hypothetical protein